jgi:hypothetical protein
MRCVGRLRHWRTPEPDDKLIAAGRSVERLALIAFINIFEARRGMACRRFLKNIKFSQI